MAAEVSYLAKLFAVVGDVMPGLNERLAIIIDRAYQLTEGVDIASHSCLRATGIQLDFWSDVVKIRLSHFRLFRSPRVCRIAG
jgi:hypothetical protein